MKSIKCLRLPPFLRAATTRLVNGTFKDLASCRWPQVLGPWRLFLCSNFRKWRRGWLEGEGQEEEATRPYPHRCPDAHREEDVGRKYKSTFHGLADILRKTNVDDKDISFRDSAKMSRWQVDGHILLVRLPGTSCISSAVGYVLIEVIAVLSNEDHRSETVGREERGAYHSLFFPHPVPTYCSAHKGYWNGKDHSCSVERLKGTQCV